jgi:hypothetical protein
MIKTRLLTALTLTVCTYAFVLTAVYVNKYYSTDPINMDPPSIKTEYFLEVSEDSIRIESLYGKVYTGKYTDLDSLISVDNL